MAASDEYIDDEPLFRFVSEHTSDVIIRASPTGRTLYVSPSCRRYGYAPETLIGKTADFLCHPDDLPKILQNTRDLLRGRPPMPSDDRRCRMRTASGDWIWMEGNPRVIRDKAGTPIEVVNVWRDVTHQWAVEARLRENAEFFEGAFQHSGVGKAVVALDGSFIRVNDAFTRLVGRSVRDMLATDFQTITHPEDLDGDLEQLEALKAGRIGSYGMEKRYLRSDGSIVWVHLTVTMVRDDNGGPKHYIAQVCDVTARREAEEALRENEARFRRIAENTSDVIVASDLDGRITFISSAAVTHTGLEPAAMLGRNCTSFMHPDDVEPMVTHFRAVAAGGEQHCIRWRIRRGDGWAWLESNPGLTRDPTSGAVTGYLDVVRDVSAQVEQEEALARARAEAEAATLAKSQFLANMSHEIRTPLTSVIGFANLLGERDDLPAEAHRYAERIAGAGRGLLAVVNDILDFSQLEAGQLEVRPRPIDLEQECRETVETFGPQAEAKGLDLSFACDGEIPAATMVDGDRLRQLLLNLVGNAVKFTDAGSVAVSLAYARGRLHVEVRDTGPGLTPAQRRRLFQRFSQVDGSSTRRHGGTGLGLAICRSLAEAMGGKVDVKSKPGEGSCFRLQLPAPKAEIPVAAEAQAALPDIAGLRVMVVDDNPANRELARALLTPVGVAVCDATDGTMALEQAATMPLDVILMDLRMPGMSGDQALAALRSRPGPNRDIPVLAFTASADVEGRDEPVLGAFDGVIRKPIDALSLYEALARATDWGAAAPLEPELRLVG